MKQTYLFVGIIFLFLIAGGLLAWRKTVKAPGITPTPQPQQAAEIPKNWKTYENKDIGVSLAYPGDWFLYNRAKWEEDRKFYNCNEISSLLSNEFILSRKDLGTCVGYGGDNWPGDFLIKHLSTQCTLWPGIKSEFVKIAGNQGFKYPYFEDSPGPRKVATIININHQSICYYIEFVQIDKQGNYDPVFDQIFSTIKFLK